MDTVIRGCCLPAGATQQRIAFSMEYRVLTRYYLSVNAASSGRKRGIYETDNLGKQRPYRQ